MQIKTTMRYHLTPVKMAITEKFTVWSFLKKLKTELPYDSPITLLGIFPKETKTVIRKDTCTPMFTAALFTNVKVWKQPKCPSTD